MKKIAVLVLAAGKSSRMTAVKQLLKIKEKTLLDIVLENAKKLNSDTVFCVLGANADNIKKEVSTENIHFIFNKNFENGLSASIVSGIKYLKENPVIFDGILILLADQPAISLAYLKSMYSLFKANPSKIIASNYGDKFGVPAIFPQKYVKNLLLIEEDKGAKELINNNKNDVLCPKFKTNFMDIDTEEDFKFYKNSILK